MAGAGITIPTCHKCCSRSDVKMRRQLTASGVSQVAWYCDRCKRWAENPVHWQSHEVIIPLLARKGATIDDLPIVNDYTDRAPCVVCGNPGEWMHWAPQALAKFFGDEWAKWPQDPLCKKHHDQWHQTVWPGKNGAKG